MAGLTPSDIVHHPLNQTGQAVLTYVSWGITAVLLVVAWRMGRKEKTPIYVLMVLAAIVGAFAEPLYDVMMSLYFYTNGNMDHTFTAFGIPQPIWAQSGYAILYALPAMYVVQSAWRGTLTPQRLYSFAGLQFVESCVFEMIGTNIGTYTYWGPHAFRVFSYPLVIPVLEAAQTVTFGVIAAQLRHRSTSPRQLLGLFAIFPVTMLGVNFGAGFTTILAIHLDDPKAWVTRVAALISVVSAAALVRTLAGFVPPAGAKTETAAYPVEAPRQVVGV